MAKEAFVARITKLSDDLVLVQPIDMSARPEHPIVIPPDRPPEKPPFDPNLKPEHPIMLPGMPGWPEPPQLPPIPPPGSPPVVLPGLKPVAPIVPPPCIIVEYPGVGKVLVPLPAIE